MSARRTPAVLRAVRPKQWVKNVLVAAAPLAAGTLNSSDTLWRTVGAVVLFTVAASGTYLMNDAADAVVDRAHPTKSLRPIAAGELSGEAARRLAVGCAVVSVAGAAALAWSFAVVVLLYLAVNVWYSAGMKHIPGVELAAIASGFVLRAVGGGAATSTPLSVWFVLVVCGGSLFIVAGKRSAELARTAGTGGRQVLTHYSGRGLHLLQAACAGLALLSYGFWVFAQDIANDALAMVSLFPLAAAFARYSADIETGRGEDPEDILLGDAIFGVLVLAWAVTYVAAVYA